MNQHPSSRSEAHSPAQQTAEHAGNWYLATTTQALADAEVLMVRVAGKQIALFESDDGIRACDNRCPHEGYPLSEGSLGKNCILTCNWHNWKFDLNSGDNMYGGDRLRIYPVEIRGTDIWLDLTEEPFAQRYAVVLDSLRDAYNDHDYDRMGREIARLQKIGADPLDALRSAIRWSWQRLEFGWTHAYAGMADWLALYDEFADDKEAQLVCLLESVAHTAFDTLREPEYPYPSASQAFDESRFAEAVEDEDENTAIALIRGALDAGLQFAELERALSSAALAHYNNFGHCLIYVSKVGELITRLGNEIAEPLLLSLVRQIVYARREDKIPEFRAYAAALEEFGTPGCTGTPSADDWRGKSINQALRTTVAVSTAEATEIYRELAVANAVSLLNFDSRQQDKVHVSVSGNIGWLDFTHGVTFANAVRKQCTRFPELWPAGLLQMSCFAGRNAAFTTDINLADWAPDDVSSELGKLLDKVLDHGQAEYIWSVHWLKTTLAVREECALLDPHQSRIMVAALSRFIRSPARRRQVRRTAHQSLSFVARE